MKKKKVRIFVFGSNKPGWHGKGAAKYALNYKGAIYGQGEGLQGESYAIPTRDAKIEDGVLKIWTLPLSEIKKSVNRFKKFAAEHPDYIFECSAFGTGLAGYSHEQIGSLMNGAPSNVVIPIQWTNFCPGQKTKDWFIRRKAK